MLIKKFHRNLESGERKNSWGMNTWEFSEAHFLVNQKGKIFKIYPKVKPSGHSKEVLEDFVNVNKN